MTSDHPEIDTQATPASEADAPETDAPEADTPETEHPEAAAEQPDVGDPDAGHPDAGPDGGRPDMDASDFDNLRLVEALLFASAEPLAPAQLARFLPEDCKLEPLLADLEALYANRGVNLVKRGGRWAFRTAEDLAPRMELENKVVRKLSRVALETLAVIAYHQPVTRAEIEEIRGVALSKGTLDALLEIGWIRPKGRRKTPGRPVTWGTSDTFLDHFGLESLEALPGVEELKAAGLLDARPALTALSDRGLLPAAGEVAQERLDDEEDDESDSEVFEGSERELLEETFGEHLLPHEVDLAAGGGADEVAPSQDDDEAPGEAPDEAKVEMFGGADDAEDLDEDDPAGDDLEDVADDLEDGDLEDYDAGEDDEEAPDDDEPDDEPDDDESDDDDLRPQRQRSAGRA